MGGSMGIIDDALEQSQAMNKLLLEKASAQEATIRRLRNFLIVEAILLVLLGLLAVVWILIIL